MPHHPSSHAGPSPPTSSNTCGNASLGTGRRSLTTPTAARQARAVVGWTLSSPCFSRLATHLALSSSSSSSSSPKWRHSLTAITPCRPRQLPALYLRCHRRRGSSHERIDRSPGDSSESRESAIQPVGMGGAERGRSERYDAQADRQHLHGSGQPQERNRAGKGSGDASIRIVAIVADSCYQHGTRRAHDPAIAPQTTDHLTCLPLSSNCNPSQVRFLSVLTSGITHVFLTKSRRDRVASCLGYYLDQLCGKSRCVSYTRACACACCAPSSICSSSRRSAFHCSRLQRPIQPPTSIISVIDFRTTNTHAGPTSASKIWTVWASIREQCFLS